VYEFVNLAAFPGTGVVAKVYVADDTNKAYRWNGSTYIEVSPSVVTSVNGQTAVVVLAKTDVGLGNVDNTSDTAKPVSTAQQTALDLKQPLATVYQHRPWVAGATYKAGEAATSPQGDLLIRKSDGTSRSLFDSTEQALWASTPYSSDYWCDLTNGIFRSGGDVVSAATLLTHNTPGTPGYVEVAPALTNLSVGFTGFTEGVIGSGGVLPTGWQSGNSGIAKNLVHCSDVVIEYSMTLSGGVTAGLRSPQYTGVNSGNWEVSFFLNMVGPGAENLKFYVQWDSNGKGLTFISGLAYAQGKGRITVTLPPSDLANDKLTFLVQNPTATAADTPVTVLMENIVVAPAVSTNLRDANPTVTGTQAALTATLNVPNGTYTVFAWTDRGIVSANATASGGTGINLRTAFGCAKMFKLAAWSAGHYVTGMVDDNPRYIPVYADNTAALAQMHTQTAGYALMALQGPGNDYNTQKSAAYWNRDRTEVRPGDTVLNDSLYKRRAEVVSMAQMPYDQDVWLSLPFKVNGSLTVPGAWGIIWQWHYLTAPTDAIAMSPMFPLTLGLGNTIQAETRSATAANPTTQPTPVTRWTGNYVPRKWHRFVARIQFSKTGGGKLGMWFDGAEVYAYQDTPIGYNKTTGPQAHWGFYGVQSDDVIVIERTNVEFGTADLSDRILNPLPI
jgi:hypothetical protein